MRRARVAINGFGRIGRLFFRQAFGVAGFDIVAVNDLGDLQNLAYLLTELTNLGIDFVGLEGSEGRFNTLETWREYPDRQSLLEVAGYLMKSGLLTGAEVAGLARTRDEIEFYGLEDKANYLLQLKAYKAALSKGGKSKAWVASAESVLKELKAKSYSPLLKELDEAKTGYEIGNVNLGDWITILSKQGRIQKHPNLAAFLDLYKTEKSLNVAKIGQEHAKILKALSENLDKNELMGLLEDCLLFRLSRIDYSEFYAALKERCAAAGIPVSSELSKYIQYIAGTESIREEALFEEMALLEKEAWKKALAGTHSEELCQADADFRLLKKALSFTLSPSEWADYTAGTERLAAMNERLSALCKSLDVKVSAKQLDMNLLKNVTAFSSQSDVRSRAFVERTARKLAEKNRNVGILVAGGFHTDGLTRLSRAGSRGT